MPFLELSKSQNKDIEPINKIKIMIFTEGTVLGHRNIFQIFNYATYIPIGNCIDKIQAWQQQGAEIIYFTSRKKEKQVNEIASVLKKYHFSGTRLYFREAKQEYKDIIELVVPDILIEDDCKCIGDQWQMCITYVKPEVKIKIKSIVVREFKGIDHLPILISDFR
jgi:hypothetical protein